MQKENLYNQDSITALASPWGESAVAIIRVSGRDSLSMLSGLFEGRAGSGGRGNSGSPPLTEAKGFTMKHGVIRVPGSGEEIDEVVVAVYRAGRSYTGENSAEIFCHGSPAIIKRILDLLYEAGFRHADPGEFTLRAFLNGKLDLTQAEAVNEIVRAKTDRARAAALSRLSGSIERKIRSIKDGILKILAAVEVRIDYPEEDLEEEIVSERELEHWQEELEKLVSTYGIGKILQEGIPVVLAGRTNAGKSTLFNQFLKEDRAIVSEIHGTTRDYLEGVVSMGDIPIKLYDTAGYKMPAHSLEKEGMKRTDRIIRASRLILYLVDASTGVNELDREFFSANQNSKTLIRIWNKIDLSKRPCPVGFFPVNAKTGEGIIKLSEVIVERVLGGRSLESAEPIIDSIRQKKLLERALGALKDFRTGLSENIPLDVLGVDLKEALDALGEITGEVTSQDILNEIFSHFCVGK